MFGFRLANTRIEEGMFHGVSVGRKIDHEYLRIKVLKDGYFYFLNAADVIVKS